MVTTGTAAIQHAQSSLFEKARSLPIFQIYTLSDLQYQEFLSLYLHCSTTYRDPREWRNAARLSSQQTASPVFKEICLQKEPFFTKKIPFEYEYLLTMLASIPSSLQKWKWRTAALRHMIPKTPDFWVGLSKGDWPFLSLSSTAECLSIKNIPRRPPFLILFWNIWCLWQTTGFWFAPNLLPGSCIFRR